MNPLIQEILQDLYKLDSTLMEKENQIVPIIEKILELKPELEVDENFKIDLKQQLIEKIRNNELSSIDTKTISKMSFSQSIKYFFSGVVVSAFIFVVFMQFIKNTQVVSPKKQDMNNNLSYNSSSQVSNLQINDNNTNKSNQLLNENDEIIGNDEKIQLTGNQIKNAITGNNQIVYKDRVVENTLNGETSSFSSSQIQVAFESNFQKVSPNNFGALNLSPVEGKGGSGNMGASAKLSQDMAMTSESVQNNVGPKEYVSPIYEYKYVGKDFTIPNSMMEVYKRQIGSLDTTSIANLVKGIDFGKININSLQSLNVDNISLTENRDFGLQLNIGFKEGVISLWQNYEKWPQINCSSQECFDKNKIQYSDWPDEQSLLNISDEFIKQYGIDLNEYGSGFVDISWKQEYQKTTNKSEYYIPEIATIIYPLKIKGKDIYEEYGTKKGITINIDIRTQKVSGVNGIENISYIASDYNVETNNENILEVAKKGGRWNLGYQGSQNQQIKEIKISDPKLEYVNIYDYRDGKNIQYVVPAMVFPVVDEPGQGDYFQKQVIVPLLKDLYKYNDNGKIQDVFR